MCFGVVGGDRRQIYLAESLVKNGFEVYTCGFEKAVFTVGVKKIPLDELVLKCSVVILPLPVTNDGTTLKAEYSEAPILLNDSFAEKMKGKRVFGGMTDRLLKTSKVWEEVGAADFSVRDEFAIRNAVPTAEGALEIAMREYAGTVSGSCCLVAGFGRVGRTLARMLYGVGAQVFVAARRPADLAWVESLGYLPVTVQHIGSGEYNLIFNTIPAMIFNRRVLSELSGSPVLIDLASAPGGTDFNAAEKIGIKAILAPSLPGRVAPKTAGEIIRDTVCRMMGE